MCSELQSRWCMASYYDESSSFSTPQTPSLFHSKNQLKTVQLLHHICVGFEPDPPSILPSGFNYLVIPPPPSCSIHPSSKSYPSSSKILLSSSPCVHEEGDLDWFKKTLLHLQTTLGSLQKPHPLPHSIAYSDYDIDCFLDHLFEPIHHQVDALSKSSLQSDQALIFSILGQICVSVNQVLKKAQTFIHNQAFVDALYLYSNFTNQLKDQIRPDLFSNQQFPNACWESLWNHLDQAPVLPSIDASLGQSSLSSQEFQSLYQNVNPSPKVSIYPSSTSYEDTSIDIKLSNFDFEQLDQEIEQRFDFETSLYLFHTHLEQILASRHLALSLQEIDQYFHSLEKSPSSLPDFFKLLYTCIIPLNQGGYLFESVKLYIHAFDLLESYFKDQMDLSAKFEHPSEFLDDFRQDFQLLKTHLVHLKTHHNDLSASPSIYKHRQYTLYHEFCLDWCEILDLDLLDLDSEILS